MALIKPFHLTPREENFQQKANINWDEIISFINARDDGSSAWTRSRYGHYGCRVYNNANISVANATLTTLTFNSELYDSGGFHSTSANTDRITFPIAGMYHVFANLQFANNATGYRRAFIFLNGATNYGGLTINPITGNQTCLSLSTVINVAANDYVTCVVEQNSGAALNIETSNYNSPHFGAYYVGE